MKKILSLIFVIITIFSMIGCGETQGAIVQNEKEESKYKIENLGTFNVTDKNFENFYNQSKNAAFAWIDDIEEDEYLGSEEANMTVFSDNSVAFLLKTVDKENVEDDSVLVTYLYDENTKKYQRKDIKYNNKLYGV
ncbi:hypothetical protein ACSXAY_11490 [Clostridium perfringens]